MKQLTVVVCTICGRTGVHAGEVCPECYTTANDSDAATHVRYNTPDQRATASPRATPSGRISGRSSPGGDSASANTAQPRAPADLPALPQVDPAGRYVCKHLLGSGGFGEAYFALDTWLNRPCVVKRLVFAPAWSKRRRAEAAQRFAREARLLASLNTPGHPNIPEIYDYVEATHSLVMKYVVGRNLMSMVRSDGPLVIDEVLRIGREIAHALFYMHSRSPHPVLHRDIKPGNILIDSERRVWLIDFGLAQDMTGKGGSEGTVGYTAPEQWRERASPASDVYALAATLRFLLSGAPPPPPPAPSLRPLLPDLPEQLDDLIIRGMAPDPVDRPSVRELLAELERLMGRRKLPAPPPTPRPPDGTRLVGRDSELAWYGAELECERVIAIIGAAGIGKTALAAALARASAPVEHTVWHACNAVTGGEGVIWTLAGYLAHHDQSELWEIVQGARVNGTPPPPATLVDHVDALLADGTSNLLLILDNLHLIEQDPTTHLLMQRLLDRARAGHIRLILTSRSAPAIPGLTRIKRLDGLQPDGAHALLAQAGVHLAESQIAAIVQATGGNPQLLILAGDVLNRQSESDDLLARLMRSDDVERFLLREVDAGLSEDERQVIGALAALLDQGGSRDAVEALVERSVHIQIQTLTDRGLIRTTDGAHGRVFSLHAILQRFFYERLSRQERRALHQRAAAYYDSEELDPLRAAQHYQHAGEVRRAAELLTREAWAIAAAGQARPLATLLAQLRGQPCEPPVRAGLLTVYGDITWLLGEPKSAQRAYEQALSVLEHMGDEAPLRILRARACRGLGRLLEVSAPVQALAWLERGLEELESADRIEEAELYNKLGAVQIRLGRLDAAQAALDRAEDLMPPGASQLRVNILTTRGTLASMRGDLTSGMAYTRQGIAICEQIYDHIRAAKLRNNLALDSIMAGDPAGALAELEQALAFAERVGDRQLQIMALYNQGFAALRTGDYGMCEQVQRAGLNIAEALGDSYWLIVGQNTLADLMVRTGRLDEARDLLASTGALIRNTGAESALSELARIQAELALAQGDAPGALQHAAHAVEYAARQGQDIERGIALRTLGMAQRAAGRTDDANTSFAEAMTLLERADPYEAARVRDAWGALMAGSGVM